MPGIRSIRNFRIFASLAVPALILAGCNTYDNGGNSGTSFRQVNLISDSSIFPAQFRDANLVNPWGIAAGPTGLLWVADNHTGKTTIYNADGSSAGAAVSVPGAKDPVGAPTGMVFNGTADFPMPDGTGKALFIFAGEDGSLSAWNAGATAKIVADRSDSEAVYKGIALAQDSGKNFLYVANFKGRQVDVFDAQFHRDTTRLFADTAMPADFAPFNVALIGSELFVAYARLKGPDNEDDSAGPGAGYVDVFGTNGVLKRRFLSNDRLNSPWAIVSIPGTFGPFENGIFIGNFGDGLIHVYDSQGGFLGQVLDPTGHPIQIDGLWALYLTSGGGLYGAGGRLYFTAGPAEESHGLFGYLVPE
ncbi:MAG: hypothetical protein JWO30_3415 [Fibrobacteres bacterium]|nr:hypothetical protein [Fibrobacterota bacterium]